MANAKLRFGAHGGLRELQGAELTLVGGGRGQSGTGGGYFDVNGGDWHRNNRIGRLAARSNRRNPWGFLYG